MMLSLLLRFTRKTRRFIVFLGTNEDEAILYLPKKLWEVMGRPNRVRVEVTPEEEE